MNGVWGLPHKMPICVGKWARNYSSSVLSRSKSESDNVISGVSDSTISIADCLTALDITHADIQAVSDVNEHSDHKVIND